ncbi:MAG: hypothetical protein QM757_40980 [Paludibaculum sp.]
MNQAAQILAPIIGFAYLCLLAFLVWRFYVMTSDVADIKQMLRFLVDEKKKRAPPRRRSRALIHWKTD